MPRRNVTSFLIALSDSAKLRDRYRDEEKRAKLLRDWELDEHPAFEGGGSIEQMKEAVADEGGTEQVENWIGVDSVEPNPKYDPEA